MSALKICPQCGSEYELDQSFCPKDGSTLRSQSANADLVGQIIADRYRVTRKLGEGGMGTVYLAEHVKMGRKSAIKVMNPGMVSDADAISRFNREAANASRINHSNVAAVYDFGETKDGLIYLAMEFIEGPSLTSVIEQSGSLSALRAAEITRQAGDALAVAHDMGIVHRDLKPDNIMLAKGRDGSDVVKIVDFGIAKAAEAENQKVTKTGLVVGTPEYMSPEQLAGDKLDGRSDTYSLALVAFAMMTGKLPFPAETVQESMIMRLTDAPKPLAEMKPEVNWPAQVQAVMDKALERQAASRYQSAAEFGRALHQAVQTMPEAAVTAAHTAVMGRHSIPKASAPTAAAPAPSIPATRVNKATPNTPPQAVPAPAPAAKSKMPLVFGGIGGVATIGIAAFMLLKGQNGTATQPDTAAPAATLSGAAPSAPVVTFSQTLDGITPLTDLAGSATPDSARKALAKLDSVMPAAATVEDTLHAKYLRAMAHFVLASDPSLNPAAVARQTKAACDTLKNNEGKFSRTRFKPRVEFFLYGDPARDRPGVC